MFVIAKQYSFSSAHHLPNHKGKCRKHHGHNYLLEVAVEGDRLDADHLPSAGMVMDFDSLDEAVKPIVETLDHQNLNKLDDFKKRVGPYHPPTAENIAACVWDKLADAKLSLSFVRVWETPKCYAEVRAS